MIKGLEDLMGDFKKIQPDLEKMLHDSKEGLKALKPIVEKNVIIDNISCILQKFDDKVTIIFPTKKMTSDYYDNFDKIKHKKRFLSWLI